MSGCIEYQGYRNGCGYGWVTYNKKQMGAHRAAWIKAYGPLTSEQHVLHKCDNRACINLDHLFIGTHMDNMRDATKKGRMQGWARYREKLTPEERSRIAALVRAGTSMRQCARDYGVNIASIWNIVHGKRY